MKFYLYNVVADGYKLNAVARNKEEVKELCLNTFDFSDIAIAVVKRLEHNGAPVFVGNNYD